VFSTTDTIVAIATPAGHGGIGIVRLSGPAAREIAGRLLRRSRPLVSRQATVGHVYEARPGTSHRIDQVVVTLFEAPASYTGDDTVEIAAHGSPVVLRQIVERAMAEGARLAEPGEFTLRAYLNERIDLVQAEAVADLIEAVTPLQARAAADQLEGTLTRRIAGIDTRLFELCARLEASLDFPDEGFHFITLEDASATLEGIECDLEDLRRDGGRGRILRDGATVVIAGRPNAGKSSLFNALVGTDRAIVTDLPGTTRDLLTERVDMGGLPVTLVDTAGLRAASDIIEAEGVRRAELAQQVAGVVLMVVDGAAPLSDSEREWLRSAQGPCVVVVTKADLPAGWSVGRNGGVVPEDAVRVSVVSGEGLDVLRQRIVDTLAGGEGRREVPAISNTRHLALVEDAIGAVVRAKTALADGATEELVLAELTTGRAALEAVVGRRSSEDLLRHIFGRFCIGK